MVFGYASNLGRRKLDMTTALVLAALVPAAYSFGPSTSVDYKVEVAFDGFLPILGGNEGKAEVKMDVLVKGLEGAGSNLRASNEMTSFEIAFNGAKLPLTLDNAVEYFPKTTVEVTPLGKIVKNDAPDKQLPVKLPGLDVKRFPDITYLPMELPSGGVEVGKEWTFSKSFGGADLVYDCTVRTLDGEMVTIGVKVKQEYEVWENDALEIVTDEAEAAARVKTVMNGKGTIVFDLEDGVVNSVLMENKSVSKGETVDGKEKIDRKLDSTLKVKRVESEKVARVVKKAAEPKTLGDHAKLWWGNAVETTQKFWVKGKELMALFKLAMQFGVQSIPGLDRFGFGG